MIPIEERVRVLNDLDRSGFYIPNVMGTAVRRRGCRPRTIWRRRWRTWTPRASTSKT